MIDVCCALILKNNKLLAVQRGPQSSHPLKWEFPGGKIQENETPERCMVREIREELLADVQIVAQLTPVEFDYGAKQIKLIPFVCRLDQPQIVLTEHLAKYWFKLDDWQGIDWAEADYELILKNYEQLGQMLG